MPPISPIIIADIILATILILWIVFYVLVQRREMAFAGDLNVLTVIPPAVLVAYGIWYLWDNPSPESLAVLLIALIFFVFFGLGSGGLTERGIVGNGGFTTEWSRVKEIWFQSTRGGKSVAVMYRINGMPGTRHFYVPGNDRKNLSRYIRAHWGKAPGDRKPE
ncbi:hypothetical protein EII22_02480 [Coriobacteriales bacterium OH1046]|nr:hypothetical protein EII22_02480 [Coriobacteriales bacterium OH1046]